MANIDRTIEIDVVGMTCKHCVQHVTAELATLSAVKNVDIILDSTGTSRVTVVTDTEIPDQALREAIDEAGYDVTEIRRSA